MEYKKTRDFAKSMDEKDPLKIYRDQFLFPKKKNGEDVLYFAGNSLGLQPKRTKEFIDEELSDWARLGVRGHLEARHPWLPYHEFLTEKTAKLVGAKPSEVVVMNSLTVNLHLMMVSFYRPTSKRFKILIEGGAFPSDEYAVGSQARFHGFDPKEAILKLSPRSGEDLLRPEDILSFIEKKGSEVALILLGNVNYLTGQAFDMQAITRAGHKQGCVVGFDLAHGTGNLKMNLHDWDVDFACWCSYKYLNSGPGAIAGTFVHERHAKNFDLPRFSGWWGHNKETRFKMGPVFDAIVGAEGWQLSNPPIFQLAALRASMELFDSAGMDALRHKSDQLTGYLEFLLEDIPNCKSITPKDSKQRGAHLSLRIKNGRPLIGKLEEQGIICDFREPDIIRVAPVSLYNRFMDVYLLMETLKAHVAQ